VAPGKTLTVPSGAAVDLSGLITSTTTAPTNPADAPVQIQGTIELTDGGIFTGPDASVLPNPFDAYKFASFEGGGKIVLNYGATYNMGVTYKLVGADSTGAAYEWFSGPSDGAQIVIDGAGLTIRDTGATPGAVVTIGGPGAFILKEQALTLETGVQLQIDTAAGGLILGLAGDAGTNGGAVLKGAGSVVVIDGANVITTITGGPGWRVHGSDIINIGKTGTTDAYIGNSATGQTSLRALGAGASIVQAAGTKLNIRPNTVVELGGSATTAGGTITLEAAGSGGGELAFEAATSKLTLGTGTGGTPATNIATISIGGKAVTPTGSWSGADLSIVGTNATSESRGVLVQIGGTAGTGISLTPAGTTPVTDDVTLASNAAFLGTP
jgi:hypothetical protein